MTLFLATCTLVAIVGLVQASPVDMGQSVNKGNSTESTTVPTTTTTPKPTASPDCFLPPQSGMCLAYIPRYHFNAPTAQCEFFVYGGCGGNGNNFKTKLDCEKTCRV